MGKTFGAGKRNPPECKLCEKVVAGSVEFQTWNECNLTLKPLTWKMWLAPNNASRWQMGFNSAFKRVNIM